MDDTEKLYALIVEIRSNFNRLKRLADELHKDLAITAPMRAIMEYVAEHGEQPVPAIARAKGVSRQHIQVNVDALQNGGLVELRDNPAHRRSSLVALSREGHAAFAEIRRSEALVLEKLAEGLDAKDVAAALRVLRSLRKRLDRSEPEELSEE